MRLIARYPSLSAAEERAAFLRSRGIATHVSNLTSIKPTPCGGQIDRAALWAVLASQYDDARLLLENPDHNAVNSLDENAMHELEHEGSAQAQRAMIRGLLITLVVLGGLLAAVLHWLP